MAQEVIEANGGAMASEPDQHLGATPLKARAHLSAGHGVHTAPTEMASLKAMHDTKHHVGVTTESVGGGHLCWGRECGDSSNSHLRTPDHADEHTALAQHLLHQHGQGDMSASKSQGLANAHEILHSQHPDWQARLTPGSKTAFTPKHLDKAVQHSSVANASHWGKTAPVYLSKKTSSTGGVHHHDFGSHAHPGDAPGHTHSK